MSEEYEKRGYTPNLNTSSLKETIRSIFVLIREMELSGIIKRRRKDLIKFSGNPLEKDLAHLDGIKNRINTISSLISLKDKLLSNRFSDGTIISEDILKSEFEIYRRRFGFEWENLCYEIAELKYENILRADKNQTRLTTDCFIFWGWLLGIGFFLSRPVLPSFT